MGSGTLFGQTPRYRLHVDGDDVDRLRDLVGLGAMQAVVVCPRFMALRLPWSRVDLTAWMSSCHATEPDSHRVGKTATAL